ncbi:MAG: protoheme IX farnesyltransferase, partial [Alphaproteobacteria bacterium]|nr:protoheme IX farnesyltransferase [Alphaproteobacteria bacterium]
MTKKPPCSLIEAPQLGHLSLTRDYIDLLKIRVMSLVVFTAAIGMALAPGRLHPFLMLVSILCVAGGAGAAGAINMWYDRDIDVLMGRTKKRPIPMGRIKAADALGFGIVVACGSVLMMAFAANYLAAFFLAFSIFFYVVIYTIWLKRRTPQNIVIGGAAGAFPPMIGWVAVTGSVCYEALVLFLIIFLWTPPHFWALALYQSEDYAKAGLPMMPLVVGVANTKTRILFYSILLAGMSIVPYFLGMAGVVYLAQAFLFWGKFILLCIKMEYINSFFTTRNLFIYLIIYFFF